LDNKEFGREVVFSIMERPVTFSSNEKNLFGILHSAENGRKKVGIIFLNAGLQYRVGPHRIYVKAARRLSQIGFCVLRMDFPGIGESEGEIADGGIHVDHFDTEDTIKAIDFLTKEEQIEKIILLGICAGARNALKTAAEDPRVDSIISWSLPIIFESEDKLYSGSMSGIAAKHYVKGWIKKIFKVRSWKSVLTSDKYLYLVKNVFWALVAKKKEAYGERQREFFEAFESFISSRRKALFVYGEREIIEREEFMHKLEELSYRKNHACEHYIVPNGDHTFLSTEAEIDVIEKTAEWLAKKYKE
jgi:pimeloyl-ACP methyl ester carboxylesterase